MVTTRAWTTMPSITTINPRFRRPSMSLMESASRNGVYASKLQKKFLFDMRCTPTEDVRTDYISTS